MSFPERDERRWSRHVAREYGCIVTLENDDGQTLVLHRLGTPHEGLRAAIRDAQRADATFLVVAFSTPLTIAADLDGARVDHDAPSGHRAVSATPEALACGMIGRRDAVHPRLLSPGGDASRRNRLAKPPKPANSTVAATAAAAAKRRAQTHCLRGHELTEGNVYRRRDDDTRHCRACRREARALNRRNGGR